jgi:hypothetical protein
MPHRFPPLSPAKSPIYKSMPGLPWGELLVATTLLVILCA